VLQSRMHCLSTTGMRKIYFEKCERSSVTATKRLNSFGVIEVTTNLKFLLYMCRE